MNLAELQAEVINLTNRPDRVAETLSAVRSATLKAHSSDYFYKDIYETGISFSTSEYIQQIEYQALIPRWRAFKYFRLVDVVGGVNTPGRFLELIVPENVLDDYSIQRENVCYVAGAELDLRSSTSFQYGILACYLNPDISTTGFTSWIAVDQPWAIIYEAASMVLKIIGKTEEALSYKNLALELYQELKLSNIVANGY